MSTNVFTGQEPQSGRYAPLVTVDDFHEWHRITTATDDDNARIQTALEIASSAIRGITGKTISPVDDETVTIDGSGASVLLIPAAYLPIRAITGIYEDATQLDATRDYEWSRSGILRRRGGVWTDHLRGVTATVSYGYDPLPRDIAGVCLSLAKRLYDAPDGAGGAIQSETLGGYSITYAVDRAGSGVGLTTLEAQVLARY